MTLLLIGFNHQTAPVSLRERAAPAGDRLAAALLTLSDRRGTAGGLQEAVLLATCNRVELYAVMDSHVPAADELEELFVQLCGVDHQTLGPHLYRHEGEAAARHLLRVASGLDSLVLGEPQILGQVRSALDQAQKAHLTGPVLSRLFNRAIHSGKRAHRETGISRYPASVSHSAVQLIRHYLAAHGGKRVLIIGAGEMARLAGRVLAPYPLSVACTNRTDPRAERLAGEISATARPWAALSESLTWADAVLTATAAPHAILHPEVLAPALASRRDRPLMLIDIAMPRDVAPGARQLPALTYHDLDDLQRLTQRYQEEQERACTLVEVIIAEETERFMTWYRSRHVAPLIGELRGWAREIAAQEVTRALNKLPDADPRTRDVIEQLSHRITNQLLHQPTVQLRAQAANGHAARYSHAVRALFALSPGEDEA